jgi:hypothetical protein
MNLQTVRYTTGVLTPAGWRSEIVTAIVEQISDKRAKVVEVLDIGGNGKSGYASRTGANRQRYSVGYVAESQIGKIKIISRLQNWRY